MQVAVGGSINSYLPAPFRSPRSSFFSGWNARTQRMVAAAAASVALLLLLYVATPAGRGDRSGGRGWGGGRSEWSHGWSCTKRPLVLVYNRTFLFPADGGGGGGGGDSSCFRPPLSFLLHRLADRRCGRYRWTMGATSAGRCAPAALPLRSRCAPAALPLRSRCAPAARPISRVLCDSRFSRHESVGVHGGGVDVADGAGNSRGVSGGGALMQPDVCRR